MSTNKPGNVFVTGAAGGIAGVTVRQLAARGFTVFAGVHHDPGDLDGAGDVRVVSIDVADPGSVAAAVGQIATEVGSGGLQVLVNNAGIIVQGRRKCSRTASCAASSRSTRSARSP